MMRKIGGILMMLTIGIMLFSCGNSNNKDEYAGPSFTIDVKIDTLNYSMAYLAQYKNGGFVKSDSAIIKNGSFVFKGKVESPNVQYILFNDSKERIVIFLENSKVSITGINLLKENVKIEGSAHNTQLDGFIADMQVFETKMKTIVDEYYFVEGADSAALAEMSGEKNMPHNELRAILLKEIDRQYLFQDSLRRGYVESYIYENLNSVISPYLALRYMMEKDIAEIEKLYNSFSPKIRNSEYVKIIEERIQLAKGTQVGQLAPLFSMNDKDGNPIALESFRGSYVLIDFWASWCAPCRTENPNVVAAYNKYHEEGFEILGVSFDEKKDKWLSAIEADRLTWSHVSDLKGWGNSAGQLYGVRGIPHSVLVDKNGVIVAKDLRGKDLHNKLAEIFGKK